MAIVSRRLPAMLRGHVITTRRVLLPLLGVGVRSLCGGPIPANRVDILRSGYTPEKIECWAGDQLSWRNASGESHELGVRNADGSFTGFFDGALAPGAVSGVFSPSLRFDEKKKPLTYSIDYVCRLHPNERGTIVVNPTP